MNREDVRPRPDPTVLTTAALKMSIDNLKELLESQIECARLAFEEKIKHNGLMDEKRHRETLMWFRTREEHRLEAKEDSRVALTAALQAQRELFVQQNQCNEEASAKLEVSTTKQLEALAKEASISRQGIYDKIDTLKESFVRGEGRGEGQHQKATEVRGTFQWAMGLIVVTALALLGNVITLIYMFAHK